MIDDIAADASALAPFVVVKTMRTDKARSVASPSPHFTATGL
jgi:hypothetical protein